VNLDRLINIVVMVTVFGLVFSVWCICVFLWLGQYLMRLQVVQQRLGIVKKKETGESRTLRLWRELQQDTSILALPRKLTLRERLEILRHDAGWRMPIQTVILGVGVLTVLSFVLTYLLGGGVLFGIGIAAAVLVIFWAYTRRRISKRTALFERQLVDSLGIAARALRAGHPLVGAFQLVSEEIGEPLGSVFSRICQEQSMGLDLRDSIRKVAKTTHNPELKLFATAVAIQFQSGGNLADLMDSLASVIRDRMRLNRRVRVITAQTQFSKCVLIGLPIILFFLLNLISPTYMEPFYTTTAGRYMLVMAISSVLLGTWVMNRISVLRY
jgi:tight adherence protein B